MPTILIDPDLVARGIDLQPLQALAVRDATVVVPDPAVSPRSLVQAAAATSGDGPARGVDLELLAERLRRHAAPVYYVSAEWPAVQAA